MEMTYSAVLKKTREIVNQHDPMSLINMGSPLDEYDSEIFIILNNYADAEDIDELTEIVWEAFVQCFQIEFVGPRNRYRPLAQDLWNLRNEDEE